MFLPDPLIAVRRSRTDDNEDTSTEPTSIADRVEQHALNINARVSRRRLRQLMDSIFEEAHGSFCDGDMETALDGFAHCIALDDYTGRRDRAFTNALTYNIGAGLHFLGEFEAAQEWYVYALEGLRNEAGFFYFLFFGEETTVRQALIESRLDEARRGLMPGRGHHLGASGGSELGEADLDSSPSVALTIIPAAEEEDDADVTSSAKVEGLVEDGEEEDGSGPEERRLEEADKKRDASQHAHRASKHLPTPDHLPAPPERLRASGPVRACPKPTTVRAASQPPSPKRADGPPPRVRDARRTVAPGTSISAPTSPVKSETPVAPSSLLEWLPFAWLARRLFGMPPTHTAVPTRPAWPEHGDLVDDGEYDAEAGGSPSTFMRHNRRGGSGCAGYELNYLPGKGTDAAADRQQDEEEDEDSNDVALPPRAAATGYGGDDDEATGGGGDADSIASGDSIRPKPANGAARAPKSGAAKGEGEEDGEMGEEDEKPKTHAEALAEMNWLLRLFAPSEVQLDLAQAAYQQGYVYRSSSYGIGGIYGGFGF